jgi:hypothetical protein
VQYPSVQYDKNCNRFHQQKTNIKPRKRSHRGRVIWGELMDATDTFQKRFTDASGMKQALATWLRQQDQGAAAPEE